MTADPSIKVIVAGGGVAGLETLLALQALAPGRFDIELLTPQRHFTYRSLNPRPPFLHATTTRVELDVLAGERGFQLTRDAVDRVDRGAREVLTQDGVRRPYDVLVLAVGTRPALAVTGGLPFRGLQDLGAVVASLEALAPGPARVLYIAVSASMWTLPLYELALHTAAWAADHGASIDVLVSTAERAPLEAFGSQVSERVLDLLRDAGVRIAVRSEIDRTDDGRLCVVNGRSIPVDLAIALPRVIGPAVRGLPHLSSGFTRVDGTGRVTGAESIYAVGDMTDRPLKQGALAAQQADVTATAIAAAAAGSLTTPPYRPVMRALLTGFGGPLRLRNPPFDGDAITESAWWPTNRIPGVRLGPLLAARGRCSAGA